MNAEAQLNAIAAAACAWSELDDNDGHDLETFVLGYCLGIKDATTRSTDGD